MADSSGCNIGEVRVIAKTDKAIRVELLDGDGEHWIPLSQIHDDSEIYDSSEKNERGDMVVTHWLARQLGFE